MAGVSLIQSWLRVNWFWWLLWNTFHFYQFVQDYIRWVCKRKEGQKKPRTPQYHIISSVSVIVNRWRLQGCIIFAQTATSNKKIPMHKNKIFFTATMRYMYKSVYLPNDSPYVVYDHMTRWYQYMGRDRCVGLLWPQNQFQQHQTHCGSVCPWLILCRLF